MVSQITDTIRQQVASDIRVSQPSPDRIRIGIPLLYNDGDRCSFFLDRDPAGNWLLTDLGDVLMRAGYSDVDLLAEGYRSRMDRLMRLFGISEHDGMMTLPVTEGRFGDAIFSFAQAALEMVRLAQQPREQKRKAREKFKQRFSGLIEKVVPKEKRDANWHDPVRDPDGIYPVDFRIHAANKDWYLFGVSTSNKCLHATISCQQYRLFGSGFRGLAIYRDKSRLPATATKPLDAVVDQEFAKFSDPDLIAGFIEERILKGAA